MAGEGGWPSTLTPDGLCGAPKDLKGTLAQELDFENEGRNAERCARELQHFRYIVVPRVHWDKSSKVGWACPHMGWGPWEPHSASTAPPACADGRLL